MNQELLTIVTAALPISELRGAIPLGLAFGFSPIKAYVLAIIGNGAIVAPILLFLRYGSGWVMQRSEVFRKVLTWLFERTRRREQAKLGGAGLVALAAFVAIPLPMTGAWTAAIAAFLFNMPLQRSLIAILIGVCIAGGVVLAISLGVISIW